MNNTDYRAYANTFMDFTEEQIAGIIKFHPEEKSKIKEILSENSWKKVEAFLNFRSDSLIDTPYQDVLKKNISEACELIKNGVGMVSLQESKRN